MYMKKRKQFVVDITYTQYCQLIDQWCYDKTMDASFNFWVKNKTNGNFSSYFITDDTNTLHRRRKVTFTNAKDVTLFMLKYA